MVSPVAVPVAWIVPMGNSIAESAKKQMLLMQKGLNASIVLTTLLFLSMNNISIEKRIKNECTELQGCKTIASPGPNPFLPSNPFILLNSELAIITSLAKTVFLVLLIILMVLGDTLPIN